MLITALRDALSRIVAARSEIESGDTQTAAAILADLEDDLAGTVDRYDEGRWAA